jgi:hypothetical protein
MDVHKSTTRTVTPETPQIAVHGVPAGLDDEGACKWLESLPGIQLVEHPERPVRIRRAASTGWAGVTKMGQWRRRRTAITRFLAIGRVAAVIRSNPQREAEQTFAEISIRHDKGN